MGHQVIRQPDGLLAVFSSGVDSWVLVDATAEELADWYAERAAVESRRETARILESVLAGQPREAYYQFAMTWEEAEETRRFQHEPQPEDLD